MIGPTGDQYEGVERINDKADIEFISNTFVGVDIIIVI